MSIVVNYDMAIIFTKHTNLLQWFNHNYNSRSLSDDQVNHAVEYYSKMQDVELVLLARHEDGHTYCKIKCPINPLPIRGEFDAISVASVTQFLQQDGWIKKQIVRANIFE